MRTVLAASLFLSAALLALSVRHRLAQPVSAASSSAALQASAGQAPLADKTPARLSQLMRGIMLPNSNVLYTVEAKNPADVPPAKHASAAINPLEGNYGQWEAVENSALAIAETATLIKEPGRLCSNGRLVPVKNPDWDALADAVRQAGVKTYIAAQSRSQDKVGDATDALTTACSNCHSKYRDKEKLEDRCR